MTRLEAAAAAVIVVAIAGFAVVGYLAFAASGGGGPPAGADDAAARLSATPTATARPVAEPTPTSELSPTPAAEPPAQPEPPAAALVTWQGREVYLHGANVPWYTWGCDFGCGARGGVSSPSVQRELRSGFQKLRDSGMHVARWWVFPGDPWQIRTDDSGAPHSINPAVFQDMDAALALAEEYDLYYVFTLFSSPTRLPRRWMADPDPRVRLADTLTPLFARYGDNPRLLSWQVFNEPEWHIWNGEVPLEPVRQTVAEIARAVHQHSGALVSVGAAHIGGLRFWTGLGLDYYTAHWYDPMKSRNDCALCTTYGALQQALSLDGPVVIGEFFAGRSVDARQRFEAWYDQGYAGAWAWSLFPDRTSDRMQIDFEAARSFADDHADVIP